MSLMPVLNGEAKICGRGFELAPEFMQSIPRGFDLPLRGASILGFADFPGFGGMLEALVGALEHPMLFDGNSALFNGQFEHAVLFRDFSEHDLFRGDAAQIGGEAQLAEQPNGPLGRVELPRFHAVAVVVLKFMMIIVIAFAEGEEGHNPTIPGRAVGRVGAIAQHVAKGIDKKGGMLDDYSPQYPGQKKAAKSGLGSAPDEPD